MGVLRGLLTGLVETSRPPADVACWLWLAELTDGGVVQTTHTPAADQRRAEQVARQQYGAQLVRVVPVPSVTRLLTQGEQRRVLGGLSASSAQPDPMDPAAWLARVAWLLGCTPSQLLASGAVTEEDAAELSSVPAHLVAALVRSYEWKHPQSTTPEPAPAPAPPAHQSAATWPPTWRASRDAYYGHIARCPQCIAHRLKKPHHCPDGAALRQRYDDEFRRACDG